MAVMLDRWNDDKMDALAGKVDGLDVQLREHRQEMREQLSEQRQDLREHRQEMREQLSEQRQDLREHRGETKEGFESLHRTMIQTTVAVLTAFVIGFAALVGLIATQL